MKYTVDRVDGEVAVCQAEDRSMVHIPLKRLWPGIREGDCIGEENGVYSAELPEEDGIERIKSLLDDLFEN